MQQGGKFELVIEEYDLNLPAEILQGYKELKRDITPKYSAEMLNGEALLDWIKFDSVLRKFTLTPTKVESVGSFKIRVKVGIDEDKLVHSENTWTMVVKITPPSTKISVVSNTPPKWTFPGT